jgi:hypothetical protein
MRRAHVQRCERDTRIARAITVGPDHIPCLVGTRQTGDGRSSETEARIPRRRAHRRPARRQGIRGGEGRIGRP